MISIPVFTFSLVLYYAIHSILAAQSVKDNLELIISQKYYRIFFNLMAIGLLGGIGLLYFNVDKEFIFTPTKASYLGGWVIFIIGLILNNITMLGYDLSEFVGTKYLKPIVYKKGELRTSGLNGFVRHPLYFSIFLILGGWFLIKPTNAVLAIFVITSLYIPIGIYFEEKKLIEAFGKEYLSYKKKVAMVIPYVW